MAQPGQLWVHLYFCLLVKVACCLPSSRSLCYFTAGSTGRVPLWWSIAYVRGPGAIRSGNCGSIKQRYDSWRSLLSLVVSGGGSKRNRSWLAGGILGETLWKGCRFLANYFCLKMTIIMNKTECFPHFGLQLLCTLISTDIVRPIMHTLKINTEWFSLCYTLLSIMYNLVIVTWHRFISSSEVRGNREPFALCSYHVLNYVKYLRLITNSRLHSAKVRPILQLFTSVTKLMTSAKRDMTKFWHSPLWPLAHVIVLR